MNTLEIEHKDGKIILNKNNNEFLIKLLPSNNNFILKNECKSTYSFELIKKIIEVKGFASLCDDIDRDQKYSYIQKPLENLIFSHFDLNDFENKRILDFGCGAGNSTVILGRILKNTEIIGIELNTNLLELAQCRADFYKLSNVQFIPAKSGDELPEDLGHFDFIFLNAVYEHLLPNERKELFPSLWEKLNDNGCLLINETPHRWFPVETHTTEGLLFINYLPKSITHYIVKKFSKKAKLFNHTWEILLRSGIRGGSVSEIRRILKKSEKKCKLLKPSKLNITDRIELFDKSLANDRLSPFKRKILYFFLKSLMFTTRIVLTPTLAFVIKKIPSKI